uniref:Integrase zinc-binding domain-containing protein n=1 Tax=Plectus sambesii TaxID=2011161 RepID=A0A914WEF0_9BILA
MNWTNEQRQYYRRTYCVDKNGVLRSIRTNLPVALSDDITRMIERAHQPSKNEHFGVEQTVAAMSGSHYIPDVEQEVRRYIEKCAFCTLHEEKKAVALELEKRTGLLVKRERYIAQLQSTEGGDMKNNSADTRADERPSSDTQGRRPTFVRSLSEKPIEAQRKKVRFEMQDDELSRSVDLSRDGTMSKPTKATLMDTSDATLRRSRVMMERQLKIDAKTDSTDENTVENGKKMAANDQQETARLQAIIDRMTLVEKQKDKVIADYHMKLCEANMRLFSAEKKLQDEKERHLASVQRLNADLVRERGETQKAKQSNGSLRAAHDRDKDRLERAQQDLNSQSERMRKMIKTHS